MASLGEAFKAEGSLAGQTWGRSRGRLQMGQAVGRGGWQCWALALVPVTVHSFSRMSGKAPPGLEGRVRKALQRVFGFESFKTSLQESATMTVVRGEVQHQKDVKHVCLFVFLWG